MVWRNVLISNREQFIGGDRLFAALKSTPARLIELIAPAGFGKTHLAIALGQAVGRYQLVEPTGEHLIRVLEENADDEFIAIVENTDGIPCHEIAALASAIEMAPRNGRIVLCGRRETVLNAGLTVAPNERLTLTSRDLALRKHEVAAVFEGLEITPEVLSDIIAFSEGWPVVVLSIRAAIGNEPLSVLENPLEVRFDALKTYLMREVVDALDEDECEALWLCSALPGIRRPQLVKVLANPSAAFRLVDLQLAWYDRFAGIVPRPILQRLMYGRYRAEMTETAARVGQTLRKNGEPLYAAAAFLAANDVPAACESLKTFSAEPRKLLQFPFHAISPATRSGLDGATIKACPELWVALFQERQFTDTPDALLHDVTDISQMLDSRQSALRNVVLALGGLLAVQIGRVDTTVSFLNEASVSEVERSDEAGIVTSVRAMLDAHRGQPGSASAQWLSVRPQFWGYEAWCTLMMLVQLKSARAMTEPAGALAIADRMCESAEKTGSPAIIGFAYAMTAFTAWIFGEEQRFQTNLSRLRRSIRQTRSIHLALLADTIEGRYENLTAYPLYFGWAKLVNAASADHPHSIELVRDAIEIAQRADDAALGVMARIALAQLQPELQAQLREESKAICEPIVTFDISQPKYEPFVRRFRRGHGAAPADEYIFVEVARGRVSKGDRELQLSLKSLELVMALAVSGAPVTRDVLFEQLWPGQATDAARSALKMAVHRTRQQLGDPDAIVVRQGMYALGGAVVTDARALFGEERNGEDPHTTFERLSGGRPSIFTTWEWFRSYEERLISRSTKIGLSLAMDAFARGDTASALHYASLLTNLDPCDETATELAIRAHLQLGERSLAISRYRQLLRALKNELDVEPSESIRTLLVAGPPG